MTPAELEGLWQPVRAELGGEPAPGEVLSRLELTLRGGHYSVRFGGEISDAGTYSQHVDALPPALSLHGTTGPNAGRTIPCILQMAGDRLRVCYGLDGTRPAAFAAPAGVARYLVTYRRIGR